MKFSHWRSVPGKFWTAIYPQTGDRPRDHLGDGTALWQVDERHRQRQPDHVRADVPLVTLPGSRMVRVGLSRLPHDLLDGAIYDDRPLDSQPLRLGFPAAGRRCLGLQRL